MVLSSEVEKIEDVLPPKDEYDPETAADPIVTLASLYDLREIGILENGEPKEGEQTWFLTETGVAWARGEIELNLEELAQDQEISEEDLYGTFSDLKKAEKLLSVQNFDSKDSTEGEDS